MMLYTTLHNRILRLVLAVLGELIAAAALNLFIVPLSLYTGGLLGFCQLVRTLLQDFLGVSFGAYDIAGVLYFLLNIPLAHDESQHVQPARTGTTRARTACRASALTRRARRRRQQALDGQRDLAIRQC